MSANFGELPFGLTDCKIYPLAADGTPGTAVSLPAGRTVEVQPQENTTTLEGYNTTIATRTVVTGATVTVEHGGVDLDVLAAITGKTVVTSGVDPDQVKTLSVGDPNRPYCRVIGKSIADDGGDTWIDVKKVKFHLPTGTFAQGQFLISQLTGDAVADANGVIYDVLQHQTAADITAA